VDLFKLCTTNDVAPDKPHRAEANGSAIAVFEVDGRYYATQDGCTHGPGSLSEGYVDGEQIECPFHQGRFSILTGNPTSPPCTIALKTWDVIVDGDDILLGKQRGGIFQRDGAEEVQR
jgi:nitrite reductase/ring-hydroxylating ferredoxin subunit